MQKIKAAFFDIDGTLLSFATRRVPASAARALQGMRDAGLRLFIASGRPPMYLTPLQKELDFRFDGYVLTNGQCCTDADGVPFYNQPLPAASVPARNQASTPAAIASTTPTASLSASAP